MSPEERRFFCTQHGFVTPANTQPPSCPHPECGSNVARIPVDHWLVGALIGPE